MSCYIKKNINIRSKDCNKKRLCESKVCLDDNHFEVSKSLITCCNCGSVDFLITEPTGCQVLGFNDKLEKWVNIDQPYEIDVVKNIKPCDEDSENTIVGAGFCTIGGGKINIITGSGDTISGGLKNEMCGDFSTIGGGLQNIISGDFSTISGGFKNKVDGFASNVCGGEDNEVLSTHSSVLGGRENKIEGGGVNNAIVCGVGNTISSNVENSVILGCTGLNATDNNTVYMCNANVEKDVCLQQDLVSGVGKIVVINTSGKLITPSLNDENAVTGTIPLPDAAGFLLVDINGALRKIAFWN